MRALVALAATGLVVAVVVALAARRTEVACGGGFVAAGWRCCDAPAEGPGGACQRSTPPSPRMVHVPDTHLLLGPSDWEAEGRVRPREVEVHAFFLDVYEAPVGEGPDGARARSGLSFAEAEAYCRAQGKRLPTEDEWLAAAGGAAMRRYPWGDTGAVCRRAAWGLADGPCARAARGPDSVGAHPDGRTPLGLEDMAGNVAEWVVSPSGPVAHGGSWRTALATDLRVWARLEIDPSAHDDRVGVRCAADVDPSPFPR